MIHDFSLGGLIAPLTMTAADHEGGGWVKIFQVKGEGFVPETQWFRAYRDLIVDREHKTAEQMAKAN